MRQSRNDMDPWERRSDLTREGSHLLNLYSPALIFVKETEKLANELKKNPSNQIDLFQIRIPNFCLRLRDM